MRAIILSTETVITVNFYDLDPMNVVWHGNYPRFLEQGRCALLDRIGYNYLQMRDSGYTWPIVDLHIRYVRPIRLETIVVTAALLEYEHRLKLDYCSESLKLTGTAALVSHARRLW
jgi:acyl-CoA thioester hydrolase